MGILDYFGGNSGGGSGLLGNMDDPRQVGMMNMALGLLSQAGPSTTPASFGQALGHAGMLGLQSMQQARQSQQENALNDLKMRGLLGEIKDKDLARQQALDAQNWYRDYNKSRATGSGQQSQGSASSSPMASVMPGGENSPKVGGPDWMQSYQASQPTQTTAQSPAQSPAQPDSTEKMFRDRMAMADAMRTSGIPALIQKADDIEKSALQFRPEFATEFRQAMGSDGKLHNYLVAKDGTIREAGLGVKPDIQIVDLGGKQVVVDKNAATNGQTFNKTMTPGEVASNGLGWANFGLSKQRLAMEQSNQNKPQFVEALGGFVGRPDANNPGGVFTPLAGAPKIDKPLTESQANANLFGTRMQQADKLINGLISKGVTTPSLIKQGVEGIPLIGNSLGRSANFIASPVQQQMEQAQRDFLNAVLRKESGAAISAGEFDSGAKQYFPQPGDSKEVIAQKAQNRQLAIQGVLSGVPASQRTSTPATSSNSGLPSGWTVTVK